MRKITTLVVLFALSLLAAGGARADARYTDPVGDSGSAADITAVAVTNDSSGNVTIKVTTDQASLRAQAVLTLFFDSDGDSTTGGDGVEYYLIYGATGGIFYHWNGSRYVEATAPSLDVDYGDSTLTFRINTRDLGGVDDFVFYVTSQQYNVSGTVIATDHAPNNGGGFDYSLKGPPPLTLHSTAPVAAPLKPVHGKALAVRVNVTRSDTGLNLGTGTVTCRVTVGLKPLRAIGFLRAGRATCAMVMPRNAKGKKVRGTIKTTFRGVSTSRAFTYLVR